MKLLAMALAMIALIGCDSFRSKNCSKDAFCTLYEQPYFNTETKEFIVDTNDPAEAALGNNKQLYLRKCK